MSRIVYLLPLALAACATGQTVEGVVTNSVTGAGIAGATVVLQQGEKSACSATTDPDGHFLIEGVKDGAYSVRYNAEHYFASRASRKASPVQVGAGAPSVRIEGSLVPFGRIAGRVTDTRGEVVPDALVELTTPSTFLTAKTDAKGRFNLDSVLPGAANYTLQVEPPIGWKPPDPEPDTGRPRGWAQTFYPGVSWRSQASPIRLEPGMNIDGLVLKLLDVLTHAVRGVLLNPDGTPSPNVSLMLWETGTGRRAAYRTESRVDGTFEFPAVAEGEWRLHAQFKSREVTLQSDEWLEVKGRDLENVKLRLSAPVTMSGRVILEVPEGVPAPSVPVVRLIQQHDGRALVDQPVLTAQPEADGRFLFDRLYPGSYVVQLGAPPAAYYLESIRQGEVPAWDPVEISAGSPDLAIVYKTNGGSVRGGVENCGTGQVLLIRQDRQRGGFAVDCDAGSGFQIGAVRPGEYYVVAVPGSDLGPGPVDTTMLQRATRITVRAGETTQVNLSLR